jgi:hypothetical protein
MSRVSEGHFVVGFFLHGKILCPRVCLYVLLSPAHKFAISCVNLQSGIRNPLFPSIPRMPLCFTQLLHWAPWGVARPLPTQPMPEASSSLPTLEAASPLTSAADDEMAQSLGSMTLAGETAAPAAPATAASMSAPPMQAAPPLSSPAVASSQSFLAPPAPAAAALPRQANMSIEDLFGYQNPTTFHTEIPCTAREGCSGLYSFSKLHVWRQRKHLAPATYSVALETQGSISVFFVHCNVGAHTMYFFSDTDKLSYNKWFVQYNIANQGS